MAYRNHVLMSILLVTFLASPTFGQAYCALRDPVRQIYEFYPEATDYRSIVRTVGERARVAVKGRLPFGLHFNELGKHTLYVPTKDQLPLGIVHVRSEKSKWGLVEVAWSIDSELRIVDFSFQRCRSSKRGKIESDEFRSQIIGKDFMGLRSLLTPDGDGLSPVLKVPDGAEQLAKVVIRSGLKTIIVTEEVWLHDPGNVALMAGAFVAFPDAKDVKSIEPVYTPAVIEELDKLTRGQSTIIDRQSVLVTRATDEAGNTMGYNVRTTCALLDDQLKVWWAVDANNRVLGVRSVDEWPDAETKDVFEALRDKGMTDVDGCATATELAAAEVLTICKHAEASVKKANLASYPDDE